MRYSDSYLFYSLALKMHFRGKMDTRWKFLGWWGFQHRIWQITSGRRKLGLAAGSISQPLRKRAKVENYPVGEEELRRQLSEHKALMSLNAPEASTNAESLSSGAVYGALQTYATPPPMVGMHPGPPLPGMFPVVCRHLMPFWGHHPY